MILCIGTTPAVQRVMLFRKLEMDAVNRAQSTLDGAAGKSVNVVKVLHTLSAHPLATGFLGGDRGEYLRAALQARGIETDFVAVNTRTRECITVIDQSNGMHTELVEESLPVQPHDFSQLMELVSRRLPGCRAVIMSGTIAPGGSSDFYGQCTRLANACGALSIIDAQGLALNEAFKARPGLVKPNRLELAATVARKLDTEAEVLKAMQELRERGAQRIVVTAGKEPVLAFDGQSSWRIWPPQIAPLNPIGSGDAFSAALAWRLLAGDSLGEACRWGVAAGSANALSYMPGELKREDVERLVQQTRIESI